MPRYIQKSFNGGEVTPAIHARNNLQKYDSALARLKNGFAHIEGCVSNRQGTEFVCKAKYPDKAVRLIPFKFNAEQTYIIEVGHKYARFIKNGGVIVYPADYEVEAKRGFPVEIEMPFDEKDLGILKYTQNADVITFTCKGYAPIDLIRQSHYDWVVEIIDAQPAISAPTEPSASWTGGSESKREYKYVVTAVKSDSDEESNRSEVVTVNGEIESKWGTSEYIDISWTAVDGAKEYNVYRAVNGIFGFIGVAEDTTFRDTKIEPDLSSTAPVFKNPFENENYPASTTWFQQRHVFANLPDAPSKYIATQIGTSKNFNVSRPLIASDAITVVLSDNGVNDIKHLLGMRDRLIIFTSEAVWSAVGSDGTFSANPLPNNEIQLHYGANDIQPVVCGRMILFIQAGGNIVRDLGYTWATESFDSDKLSIWAQHLFEGKTVVSAAFAKEPYQQLFCIMDDGSANVLTYDKNQDVCGWGQYITKGNYESVATIREGNEDIVYFVVKRNINGTSEKFIERQASRVTSGGSDGCFADCSLKYSGEPISHVFGLEHLEGETVSVIADGGFYQKVVMDGSIDLEVEASQVTVGLGYEFLLKTLNIEGENTHGLNKCISQVDIGIYNSREDFGVLVAGNTPYEVARSHKSIEDDNALIEDIVSAYPDSDWDKRATVTIIQNKSLPLTITSISTVLNVQPEPTDETNT